MMAATFVHELLGGHALGFGLSARFSGRARIGAGLKEHVVALHALKAGDGVRHNLVHVADVGLSGRGNGCCEIILSPLLLILNYLHAAGA